MRALTRYVLAQLLAALIFISLGLTLAVWLAQSLRWLSYVVNRGLPATMFLSFVGLLLPSFLGVVLPIAAFCAVLFVYNKLVMDSELVVMRAAGFSQLQLARPAIILAGLVTLSVYSITLYVLPVSYSAFKNLQYQIRNDYSTVLLQEGTFNAVSDDITVYVRERTSDGELRGVLVHDSRDPDRPVTMMAERGALVRSDTGPRVVMVNGNRQQTEAAGKRLSLLYFDRYTIELAQFQETPQTRWRDPKERFVPELLQPQNENLAERQRRELIAEGHWRIVAPLYVLTFALVGLAALLSGEFNRRGQMRRILVAIACVAALEALSLALHDLANRTLDAVPAMYAGPIVPMMAALFLLLRPPQRRASDAHATEAAAT